MAAVLASAAGGWPMPGLGISERAVKDPDSPESRRRLEAAAAKRVRRAEKRRDRAIAACPECEMYRTGPGRYEFLCAEHGR
jgi:hypothetical protein